jgi:ATP-dependent RNA helicase DeaD
MGLNPKLLQRIIDKGFEEPTPIQMRSIPVALKGLDIMGQAKTGTGKTLAFGLPILNKISANQGLQALILCPTRELTVQVAEEMSFFGKGLNIHTLPVYGGQSIEIQLRALKDTRDYCGNTGQNA